MKELSVFVDESGDFGEYDPKSPFYVVGLVIHNQADNLSRDIKKLDAELANTELKRDFIHVGPLIRREKEYKNMNPEERLRILKRFVTFANHAKFLHKSFYVEKKHIEDESEIVAKLARQLSVFVKQNLPYFLDFDTVKVYYDNGQSGVMQIILSVLIALLTNAEYKKAEQRDYKMLQVADLVCTATLTKLKMERKMLSRSERRILGSNRDINKNLLKPLAKKEFSS